MGREQDSLVVVPVRGISCWERLVGGSPGNTKVFALCGEINVSRMDAWTSDECK